MKQTITERDIREWIENRDLAEIRAALPALATWMLGL